MGGETDDKTITLWKKTARFLAAAFGFVKADAGMPPAGGPDAANRLAGQRTDLAMERTYMASERTLMGWIRTALSMISFGFTLGKLGQALDSVEVKGFLGMKRMVSVESMAYFLVVLGTLGLLAATVQFRIRTNELQARGLPPRVSIAFYISLVLTVVGGFALTALVMNL